MAVNYHKNTQNIAKILRNAHNPEVCTIRKDFFQAEFNFLKQRINGKNILIAWSGLGHDSFELAEYVTYIIWIELIQVFVDEANENLKKTNHTNISFVQWDFLCLDYPDKYFDVTILNMWTIGNFDDKKSVIQSLLSVASKLYFWFREPNEKDVPIRLQMYQEEKEFKNILFEIKGTTIKENISWLESNCTSREEIEKIAQSLWSKISFYPIFHSFTMAELSNM
jgi:hypothetical protein